MGMLAEELQLAGLVCEPAVGDGDAVGVAREISEHRLGSAERRLWRFLNAGNDETFDAHLRPAFQKRCRRNG
jgi:hypothetical protein